MNTFKINEDNSTLPTIELRDKVQLTNQTQEVVKCIESGVLMLNIDADQLKPGDLKFIKSLGLTISNPETEKAVALGVEYKHTFGEKLTNFFDSDNEDDDDSSFFSPTPHASSGSLFGGSSGFGGFGGGFGGFGGGSFSGGGMSRGF